MFNIKESYTMFKKPVTVSTESLLFQLKIGFRILTEGFSYNYYYYSTSYPTTFRSQSRFPR